MFGMFKKNANVTFSVVDRGGYWVVRRTYKNGNVKTDRLGAKRANSSVRSAINGPTFG